MVCSKLNSQKRTSRSLESIPRLSQTNDLYKNEKFNKSFHLSLLNLCQRNIILKNKTIEQQKQTNRDGIDEKQQQQETYSRRRSIIKTSDIRRSISKKSVTFASSPSVFNLPENEHENDHMTFHHENHKTIIGKNLVIIIRNRHRDDDTTTESSDSNESYTFRPKSVSLTPSSQVNFINTSHHSRKNIIQHIIHHNRPSTKTSNRSNSTPNLRFRPTSKIQTNNSKQSTKTFSKWFGSSPLNRFVRSFGKHSNTKPKHNNSHDLSKFRRLSNHIF